MFFSFSFIVSAVFFFFSLPILLILWQVWACVRIKIFFIFCCCSVLVNIGNWNECERIRWSRTVNDAKYADQNVKAFERVRCLAAVCSETWDNSSISTERKKKTVFTHFFIFFIVSFAISTQNWTSAHWIKNYVEFTRKGRRKENKKFKHENGQWVDGYLKRH